MEKTLTGFGQRCTLPPSSEGAVVVHTAAPFLLSGQSPIFHCEVSEVGYGTLEKKKPPAMQVDKIALALCKKPPVI